MKVCIINTRLFISFTLLTVLFLALSLFCLLVVGNGRYPGMIYKTLPDDSVWRILAHFGLIFGLILGFVFYLLSWSARSCSRQLIFSSESFSLGTKEYRINELDNLVLTINKKSKGAYGDRNVLKGGRNWLLFQKMGVETRFELFIQTSYMENELIKLVEKWMELNHVVELR